MALESVVLLKNANAFLPLKKESLKSIAVIGPLADSVHWDWYGGTPPYAVTPLQGIKDEVGPNVKVNYAADEIGNAAVNAARSSDVAVVVVGNDPTCGPDMAHDWHATSDGGGTLPCTVPSDGREGRDRESIDAGAGAAGEAGLRRESEDRRYPGLQLPVCYQLDAGECSGDSAHDPLHRRMKALRSRRCSSATTTPAATW